FMLRRSLHGQPRQVSDVCDATTQTDGYHEMTNQEMDATIAERLGHVSFPLFLERDVELHDNYSLRLEYKSAGARYDGAARRWFMRAGSDLRPVLFLHRTWVDNPELLYRECLFVALRRANAVEELF
ncbi:MAG: hypothetical protein ACKPKO_25795, partial [Candidatus Fonsibacter sp.]